MTVLWRQHHHFTTPYTTNQVLFFYVVVDVQKVENNIIELTIYMHTLHAKYCKRFPSLC